MDQRGLRLQAGHGQSRRARRRIAATPTPSPTLMARNHRAWGRAIRKMMTTAMVMASPARPLSGRLSMRIPEWCFLSGAPVNWSLLILTQMQADRLCDSSVALFGTRPGSWKLVERARVLIPHAGGVSRIQRPEGLAQR